MEWARGRWDAIHVTAAWSDTPIKFNFFCSWIRDQVEHLPCQDCINHAKAYINANPPEEAEDSFIWSWRFHNAVNSRLGKPELEYEIAKQKYLQGGMKNCTGGCGQDKIKNTYNLIPSK